MTALVLLGGGQDAMGIAERAWRMGIETLVVDQRQPEGFTSHWLEASCYDAAAVLGALKTWCDKHKRLPDGVLSAGTDTPDIMTAVGAVYNLPCPRAKTAQLSRDKLRQTVCLSAAGVNVPDTRVAEYADRAGMNNVPIVFKPSNSRGGRGVQRYAPDDFIPISAVQRAAEYGSPVLVQRWIEGDQVSSESLVQDGKLLWTVFADRNYARLQEFKPYVIEDGCQMPSAVPSYDDADWQGAAEHQLRMCINALGFTDGVLKADLVLDGMKVWVIEVATRLSGGRMCSDITPEVWGVDFVGMAIRLALGDYIWPGEISPYLRRYACQRFHFPKRPECHPDRGQHVISFGPSPEEAEEAAQKRLHILIEDYEKERTLRT